jgi:hypothetical protein
MIRLATETDTAYEPYTGNQISVNWEDEAGTIYGGEDEVISGKLKKTMGMVDMGTLNWTLMPNDKHLFYASIPGIKPNEIPNVAANIKSDRYKTVSASAAFGATKDCVIGQGITGIIGNVYIMVVNRAYSDAASFKTAMSGAQLVYEIAEPVEYTLTGNEMETLYGTNNIWADTGDVEVTYPCDTRLFIEKLTQPTEDDMTADANIAANTFFMIGNTLYFSTAAIAQGATIIPGTNCNVVSLADALNQLNT